MRRFKHFVFPHRFKFFWPQKIHSRGACITDLRPHLHNRFKSEGNVGKQYPINPTYMQRRLIFTIIDEHIRSQLPHVHWEEAVVIDNWDIELSAYKLENPLAPLLVQPLSSHFVYDCGQLYPCNDIYESIGVWFYLLHTRYKNRLFDTDMTSLVRVVLEPLHLFVDYDRQRRIEQEQQRDWEL